MKIRTRIFADEPNFSIEFSFRNANFTDFFELLIKILVTQECSFLESLRIHDPALDGVVFHTLACPDSEPNRSLVIDLEAHGDDHFQIVVGNFSRNFPISLGLNY